MNHRISPTNTVVQREYLDCQEAEDLTGIKKITFAQWRMYDDKGPPFIRAGRKVLYRRTDLEGWLDARRRSGGK